MLNFITKYILRTLLHYKICYYDDPRIYGVELNTLTLGI
jgi:hypothetical protein